MTPRALAFATLALLSGAMGCAPSITHLVAERRYADAICLASSQAQADATLASLEKDLAPRVLVERAPTSAWTALLGPEQGDKASKELVALRTMWVVNRVSAEEVTGGFVLAIAATDRNDRALVGGREYARRAAVARAVGEQPPAQHVESWNEHLARPPPRDPVGTILSLFVPEPTIHHEYVSDPERPEWNARAPRTSAIFDALERGANAQGIVVTADEARSATLSFAVVVRARLYDGEPCEARFRFDVPTSGAPGFRDPMSSATSRSAHLENAFGSFEQ